MKALIKIAGFSICISLLLLSQGVLRAEKSEPADLLLVNAEIITMEPAVPRASALAVKNGKIIALGSPDSLAFLRGPNTEIVDAGGRAVLPGFVDSHIHLLEVGQAALNPSLNDKTLQQIEEAVRKAAPSGSGFVRMRGWGAYVQQGQQRPTNELLDRWAPDKPVVLERGEGHVALYNSAALKALDIDKLLRERHIPQEYMERDSSGRPTGILVEEANWAAVVEIDRRDPDSARLPAVQETLSRLRQYGVTSIENMLFSPEVVRSYKKLLDQNSLTCRIDVAILGRTTRAEKEQLQKTLTAGADPAWLRLNASKYFMDGAIGAGTGALLEPYSSDPKNRGILQWKNGEEMASYLEDDLALGLQSIVHAMGDRAIRTTLDAFEAVFTKHGPADYRFRIEHGNMPTPEDFKRWLRMGVIWSYQPSGWTERYRAGRQRALGDARLEYTENAEEFLANGMPVAIGSDAPFYVDINPLVNISNISARHAHNQTYPRNIPVMRALEMATRNSAFAAREETSRGSLAPGKYADLIILSANPLEVPPDEIRNIVVLQTILGGKTVYKK